MSIFDKILLRVAVSDLKALVDSVAGADEAMTIELLTRFDSAEGYTLADLHPKAVADIIKTKNRRSWLRFTKLED